MPSSGSNFYTFLLFSGLLRFTLALHSMMVLNQLKIADNVSLDICRCYSASTHKSVVGEAIILTNKTSGMVNSVLEESWWFSSPTLMKTLVMWGVIALIFFILFRIRSHYKGLFLTKGIDIGGLHLNLFSLLSVLLVVLLNIMIYLCCMKFAYFDIIVESLHSGRLSSIGEISKVYTYIADSQIKICEVHSAQMWAVLDTVRDLRSELESVKIQSSQLQDEVVRLHTIMNGLDSASTDILSENVVTDSTTK